MDELLKNTIENYNPSNLLFKMEVDGWGIAVYKMAPDSLTLVSKDGEVVISSVQVDVAEFDYDTLEIMDMCLMPKELKDAFLSRIPELEEYLEREVWQK